MVCVDASPLVGMSCLSSGAAFARHIRSCYIINAFAAPRQRIYRCGSHLDGRDGLLLVRWRVRMTQQVFLHHQRVRGPAVPTCREALPLPGGDGVVGQHGVEVATVSRHFFHDPVGQGDFLIGGFEFNFRQEESFVGSFKNIHFPKHAFVSSIVTCFFDDARITVVVQHVFCIGCRDFVFKLIALDAVAL